MLIGGGMIDVCVAAGRIPFMTEPNSKVVTPKNLIFGWSRCDYCAVCIRCDYCAEKQYLEEWVSS